MASDDTAEPDEGMIRALRELALRIDPVPPEVRTSASAAFTWRTIDAELAALTYDSLSEGKQLAGVRGPEGPRQLTFEGGGLTVEVEVDEDRALVGQIVPPSGAELELQWPGGSTSIDVDDLGRFTVSSVPRGPVSFRCRAVGAPDAPVVRTDWVLV